MQRGQHGIEPDAAGGRIVVGIGVDLEAGAFEHRIVIFPARIADPDLDPGIEHVQEVGSHLESAAAAQRLRGDYALLAHCLVFGAEQQMLRGAVERSKPVHRQIVLGLAGSDEFLLGELDAVEHRHFTVVIAVDADAQIDLVSMLVGKKSFGHADDGVDRRQVEGSERG